MNVSSSRYFTRSRISRQASVVDRVLLTLALLSRTWTGKRDLWSWGERAFGREIRASDEGIYLDFKFFGRQ